MMQDEESAETVIPAIEGVTPPFATNTALTAFYADRKRMWSNVFWITFGQFGMSVSMTIVEPLMNLRLKAIGVSESCSERSRVEVTPALSTLTLVLARVEVSSDCCDSA